MILPELPVSKSLPDILAALRRGHLALGAQTGSGKTTVLPPWLAERGAVPGRILVLEPRRLAARASAARAAQLLGQSLGKTVGYSVRGDSRTSAETRLEYVTSALFLRRIQEDPFLDGVSLVIFDEFHERSWVGDLSLAFALEAAEAREDLRLAVMSATLDASALAGYLGGSSFEVAGRAYPVELAYRPPRGSDLRDRLIAGAEAIREALNSSSGDVLAFLPGAREIADMGGMLASLGGVEVLSLQGSMSLEAQTEVIAPAPDRGRRVILATNVAEASLTVPRITAVVDLGLSRFMDWHEASGMNRLRTAWVSLAEAEQRRGRAGRLSPGICYRIWPQSDTLPDAREPEIARSDLSALALECAYRGANRPESLRWLDRPSDRAWDRAMELLRATGLIDASGQVSARGRLAVGLGTDPRFGAAIATAKEGGRQELFQAAVLAAAVAAVGGQSPSTPDTPIMEEAQRLCSRAGGPAFSPKAASSASDQAGDALAPGFPDRLARLCPDGTWLFASGRKARLAGGLTLGPREQWLVAMELDAGEGLALIREALPVRAETAQAVLERCALEIEEIRWRVLTLSAWSILRHGAIVLRERRLEAANANQVRVALEERVAREGQTWLPWDDASLQLLARLRYAARLGMLSGITEADWSEQALASSLGAYLAPYLAGPSPSLSAPSLRLAILDRLGPAARVELEREAPDTLTTPGGRARRPDYPTNGDARLAMRIQEAFGMSQSPTICGRPLVIELLTPADRVIQTTADLSGFWDRHYPGIRQELKRRYPKHFWPQDPRAAPPTRGLPPR